MGNYIFEQQSEAREFQRLQLLEAANDPTTIDMLGKIKIQSGWSCLEIGAGAGSILRWLGQRVGPSGLAVGVDKTIRYLQDFTSAPFQIHQGTLPEIPLSHVFDLIHGRYILIHNQADRDILRNVFSLLKPGGWALFEEPDFTSATLMNHDVDNSQARVNRAICQMFMNAGLDPSYALGLPPKLEHIGFRVERAQSIMHLCPGNSPIAKVIGESALVLEKHYCDTGLCSPEDIRQYVKLSQDPNHWTVYHSTTSVIAQKPAIS